MKAQRIAVVATWILVSLLAVVGFANFNATDPSSSVESPATTYAAGLGEDAGAASAMAFAFMANGRVVARAQAAPAATTLPESEPSESDGASATTFVRSTVLNESAVREIVSRHFPPEDVGRSIRSAWCASNFDPGYQHSESGAAGLFQLTPEQWATHAPAAGYGAAQITDPDANAAVTAWIVYEVSGSWSNLACSG